MKQHEHPWILCGPWYRWRSDEDPGWGPTSRPILQKYASADFVNGFLENPQHSLVYNQKDFIRNGAGTSSNRRKIFLDTHSRFYLIVCELHCETAGFPIVPHGDACEAGFVVRRRQAPIPAAARPQFEQVLTEIARARYRLAKLGVVADERPCSGESSTHSVSDAIDAALERKAERIRAKYRQAKEQLDGLIAEHEIHLTTQAWVPSKTNGDGAWQTLGDRPEDEMPQQIEEEIFPLYPLIPDPSAHDHPSGQRSLWFGVLPTGSSDSDATGNPRFDDRQTYEVRCFVRRHLPGCPKKSARADCSGEIVWSRPTGSYQLAPHFDLDGTSNKLVTIQLPDLNALKSQVEDPAFQVGQGAGVAMISPPDSELEFKFNKLGFPTNTGTSENPSICFFAIPLITIVATFLLRLVMPIVVYLFSLYYLLSLKFCILPTVSLSGELTADFEDALQADLDISAAEVSGDDTLKNIKNTIDEKMGLNDFFKGDGDEDETPALSKEDYRQLAHATLDQSADFTAAGPPDLVALMDSPSDSAKPGTLPDRTLVFYETITEVPPR